jgi:hypothetical protein
MVEQQKRRPSKVLRGIAVTLMGMAVVLTLLGGVGTTCVAFGAEDYSSMVSLVPYKPLYQALVIVSLAVGIWGIAVTISLLRGRVTAYRDALLVLFIGALSAGVQMVVSQTVRGASAPVNVRFYVTAFTLVVFLLLRLPPLWERIDFTQSINGGGSKAASAGTALIVSSIVTLTIPVWAGPSHMLPSGDNWADVLAIPLQVSGWGMMLTGVVLLLLALDPLHTWLRSRVTPLPSSSKVYHGGLESPLQE